MGGGNQEERPLEPPQWGGATRLGLRWADGTHQGQGQLCITGAHVGLGAPLGVHRAPTHLLQPQHTPHLTPFLEVGIFRDLGETFTSLTTKDCSPLWGSGSNQRKPSGVAGETLRSCHAANNSNLCRHKNTFSKKSLNWKLWFCLPLPTSSLG